MSSANSPCAACKFLRRKCTQGCVFARYFPPDNPVRFAQVHRVFGASNVAKLLNELAPAQREDAVNSLAYEAEARLNDPVYGCVGYISLLQHRLLQLQRELSAAKKELAPYFGPQTGLHSMMAPGIEIGLGGQMEAFRGGLDPQQTQQLIFFSAPQIGAFEGAFRSDDAALNMHQRMGSDEARNGFSI